MHRELNYILGQAAVSFCAYKKYWVPFRISTPTMLEDGSRKKESKRESEAVGNYHVTHTAFSVIRVKVGYGRID